MQANLAPPPTWRTIFRVYEAPFAGEAQGYSFSLRRTTGFDYRKVKTSGQIAPASHSQGSLVTLRYPPPIGTLLFAVFWLGIVGTAIGSFSAAKILLAGFDYSLLIPIGIWLAGIALFTLPTWREIKKTKKLLTQLLELQLVDVS
ncbi:MAG: hypothetical protein EOO62_33955 [Hymenobacter sp.]|nr:MAG: hypothetical protein EOO62_33955 [Hymenobacter sp.]